MRIWGEQKQSQREWQQPPAYDHCQKQQHYQNYSQTKVDPHATKAAG
jgi:hypothetical protein